MHNRATTVIRIALVVVAALGAALYFWGIADFHAGYNTLLDKGYGDAAATTVVGDDLVVGRAYRQFRSLDIANAASLAAVLALIAACSWQGGATFRLPHRLALVAGLPLSFVWLIHGLLANDHVTSLDHLAVGLLRYDEDGMGGLVAAVLMLPSVVILWLFTGFKYERERRFAGWQIRNVNAFLAVLTLAAAWIGFSILSTGMFSDARYDHTSAHSFVGLGPFLLFVWCASCLIIGRAAAFTLKKSGKP